MKVGINLSIDVTKIDKSKLYQGKKGTYLDVTMFVDLDSTDQYGSNGMVTQSLPKEERDAGHKGAILGNSKVFWRDEKPQQMQSQPSSRPAQSVDESDVPF